MRRDPKKGSKDKNVKKGDDLRGDEFKTLRGHLLKFGVDV
jgi:hypothetical protein